jgi:hypothetical protein
MRDQSGCASDGTLAGVVVRVGVARKAGSPNPTMNCLSLGKIEVELRRKREK